MKKDDLLQYRDKFKLAEAKHVDLSERSYNNRHSVLNQRQNTNIICTCHYWFDLIKLFSPFGMDYNIVYHNFFVG